MKVKVYAETNRVGSRIETEIEIPDEDIEGLEGYEREKVIDEYAHDALPNLMNWGWYEEE